MVEKHTVLLHDSQELDNDLGGRSDQDLTLASLLGIVHGIESVVKNRSANHFDGIVEREILRSGGKRGNEVSIRNRNAKWNRKLKSPPPNSSLKGKKGEEDSVFTIHIHL